MRCPRCLVRSDRPAGARLRAWVALVLCVCGAHACGTPSAPVPANDRPADDRPADDRPADDTGSAIDAADARDRPPTPPPDGEPWDAPHDATPPMDGPVIEDLGREDTALDAGTPVDIPALDTGVDAAGPEVAPLDRPVATDIPAAHDVSGPTDGGPSGTWELVGDFSNGLWQWGHFLAAAPDGTLYVARSRTGVYQGVLRDGRYTWTLLPTTGLTNLAFSAVAVNGLGEPLLGCYGTMNGGTGPGSIFRYDPAGRRWITATVPAPGYTRNVSDFYLAPDGSLFVTGGWSALLLRSTDHGSTFTLRNNLDTLRSGVRYGLLFSVEVGPSNEMIVGAETESFQHSYDQGLTFAPVDTAPWMQRGNPYGVGFTRTGEGLFSRAIDVDPTKIYRRDTTRGWVRADTGLDRDPINAAPANGWINTILLTPWGDNFIATATTVYRARDGGPWAPFTAGIDTAQYTAYPNAIVFARGCVYVALRPVAARTDIGAAYRYCGPP